MSPVKRSDFPSRFPAAWARSWGQDQFGLFADLDVKGITQRFRWINPSTFMMGSPETELERDEDEVLHHVTLSLGFWLADTACTQALWLAVMGENPSRFQENPNRPVESVSWNDVQMFIAQLNRTISELPARLPTEAEWEVACRAGTVTPFSFGDTITTDQVNYNGDFPYADAGRGENREKTVAVKTLPPNPWGLYEMHGNVREWCQDWYGDYPAESVADPKGPETGSYRVLRGGSWIRNARSTRSAFRGRNDPDVRYDDYGFRLALGEKGVSPVRETGRRPAAGRTVAAEPDGQAGPSALAHKEA